MLLPSGDRREESGERMVSTGLSGYGRMRRHQVRCLASVVLLVVLIGCSARPPYEPDRSQDQRILAEVAARLSAEPALRPGSIRVEVHGGTVILHGAVRGIGEWQCALANAALVSGVRSVADFLVLERGARTVNCLAPRPDSSTILAP